MNGTQTTADPDATALYAAIVAHPDEDTPRLMFADWLQEHGEEARAEFIRVQVEWERARPLHCESCTGRIAGVRPGSCAACEFRERAAHLFARHKETWRRGPKCEKCGGSGHILRATYPNERFQGDTIRASCTACYASGDAGGLLRKFDYEGTNPKRGEPVRLTWSRGFPFRVEVPRLSDALEQREKVCPRCDGFGDERLADAAGYMDDEECRVCRGTGNTRVLVATSWLAAVLRAHPVREVVPLDREPDLSDHPERSYGWQRKSVFDRVWPGRDGEPYMRYAIPDPLFEMIDEHETTDSHVKYFHTSEDAITALARAVAAVARSG